MSVVNYIVIQMIYIVYHCIKHRWIQVVGNVPLICEINTIYWILRAIVGPVLCLIKKVKSVAESLFTESMDLPLSNVLS